MPRHCARAIQCVHIMDMKHGLVHPGLVDQERQPLDWNQQHQ